MASSRQAAHSPGVTQPMRVLNLYAGIGGNRKLLRNAVDPVLGLHVFQAARPVKISEVRANVELFSELANPAQRPSIK